MLKRGILALLVCLLAALLIYPGAAQAHAIVLRSDPPDGAALTVAPRQVRLWLSEPVALDFTTIELIDSGGRRLPATVHSDAASLAVAVRGGGASTALLLIDLPALMPSAYRLSWRTLSSGDLHTTSGSIVFGVQRAADLAPVAEAATAPPPAEVLLRWLDLGALATLIGALALATMVAPATTSDQGDTETRGHGDTETDTTAYAIHITQVRRRLLGLAIWSGVAAMVVGSGLLLSQALAAGSAADPATLGARVVQIIAGTSYGSRWLLRQGLLSALVVEMLLLRFWTRPLSPQTALTAPEAAPPPPYATSTFPRTAASDRHAMLAPPHAASLRRANRAGRRALGGLAAGLALALVVTQALNSHAAAATDASLVSVTADTLHLLAASLWVGGLLALAVAILPRLRKGQAERALAWSVLRRFGWLASASLATLLITGLYASGRQIASLDALLTTLYGQALLLKIGLALGVALIGLLNAASLHPRVAGLLVRALRRPAGWTPVAQQQIGRLVRLEALGALTLLLLAALLSATQPARGPAFDPPAEESIPPTITTRADDLMISLSIKPNQPGQNFLGLGVFDTRRPAPAPIDRVTVRLQGPGARGTDTLLAAEPRGGGRYQIAGSAIGAEGDWRVTIAVSRQGLPETRATIPWNVMPLAQAVARRPVLISNRPLAPLSTLAALLIALALIGAGAVLWLRRRRIDDAPLPPLHQQAHPTSVSEERARP